MASAELAVVRDEPAAVAQRDIVDGWVAMASDVFKLAAHICDTDFVPKAYRGNAPATAAAILTGRELNMGPMMSLKHVQVVEGNPSLSAEYKRARVLAAGHEFSILEWNSTRCKVKGRRRGTNEPPLEVTYTMDDARKAGLVRDRSGWVKRPRRMLFARAGTDLCDALFSDVVNGLPTAELLAEGSTEDEFAGYDEADGQEPPKASPRTARRKTAAAGDDTRSRARSADAPASAQDGTPGDSTAQDATPRAAGAAPSRGAQPLPPLPGEDEPDGPGESEHAADLAPGEAAEFGTERHRNLIGIVRKSLVRFGYPNVKDETDEQRAARLEVTAKLAGVSEIGSSSDLDVGELSKVADALSLCKNREALDALLKAGEVDD
jgi:hypothetical protein